MEDKQNSNNKPPFRKIVLGSQHMSPARCNSNQEHLSFARLKLAQHNSKKLLTTPAQSRITQNSEQVQGRIVNTSGDAKTVGLKKFPRLHTQRNPRSNKQNTHLNLKSPNAIEGGFGLLLNQFKGSQPQSHILRNETQTKQKSHIRELEAENEFLNNTIKSLHEKIRLLESNYKSVREDNKSIRQENMLKQEALQQQQRKCKEYEEFRKKAEEYDNIVPKLDELSRLQDGVIEENMALKRKSEHMVDMIHGILLMADAEGEQWALAQIHDIISDSTLPAKQG